MSRLAELLGHGSEEGRVLRSHAALAASPKVKHLVYKRKATLNPEKKKKKTGVKRAPPVVVEEAAVKKRKTGVKRAPPVVVEEEPGKKKKRGVKGAPPVVVEEEAVKKKKRGVKGAPPVVVEEEPVKKKKTGVKRAPVVVVEEEPVKSATLRLAKGLVTTTTTVSSWSVSLSSADAVAAATEHLLAAEEKFESVVGKHGAPEFERDGSGFTALVKSIVYQQLAGKAAATIHGRLVALCGGPESVTPAVVAALTAEQFKAAGISLRKGEYLRDLAEKFLSGDLSDEKLAAMSEDDLITALTAVKGIGVWSAQMFMIFHLHKSDVLPVGDLGIRRGFQKLYEMKKEPSAAEMMDLSISWRPYRTLAAWYLWRVK